jgi:intracellular septation protein
VRFGEDLIARPDVFGMLEPIVGAAALEGSSGPLFLATAVFMVAISVALSVSYALTRHLPKMAVVTAVGVLVFGGLTLWLQDPHFIKMKPTIVNLTFAAILGFGLLQGRSYLKYLMGEAIPLTDEGWMIFTRRWVMFFLFLAAVNEVVWRTTSDEFWAGFKIFGNLPLTFLFVALQWPLLQRYGTDPEQDAG